MDLIEEYSTPVKICISEVVDVLFALQESTVGMVNLRQLLHVQVVTLV